MTSCSSQPYRCQNSGNHSLKVKLSSAGLAACCADLVTFPLDTAKVRLQIQNTPQNVTKSLSGNPSKKYAGHGVPPQYRGMYGTLRTITLREGPRALYAGLGAGLQRQMCFASIRIGFYEDVKNHYQTLLGHGCDETASIFVRIVSGLTTGALSVTVAHPTDVVKVRMQAQGATGNKLYTGAFQAYREIARKEGIRGLWKGYLPNVARNSLTNVGELVTYDIIKEKILRHNIMTDSFPCHVISGFGAGFFATLISSPVDVVKTRYMNSHPNEYNGVIDCALKMFQGNGPMSFYKGFLVSFTRFGSWNIVMFVCYEQMKRTFSGKQLRGDCETIATQELEKKSTLKPQVQNRIN